MPRISLSGKSFSSPSTPSSGSVSGRRPRSAPLLPRWAFPPFAWLVVGMLLVEVLAGLALKTHPSAIVTMPIRVAGLITSFVVCYVMLGVLKSV